MIFSNYLDPSHYYSRFPSVFERMVNLENRRGLGSKRDKKPKLKTSKLFILKRMEPSRTTENVLQPAPL